MENLLINQEKKLVTADGDPVLGKSGEITIDGQEFFVENDGSVFVGNGFEEKAFVDTIKIVDFEDKKISQKLRKKPFLKHTGRCDRNHSRKFYRKTGIL